MLRSLALLVLILAPMVIMAQAELGKPALDRSKPVPSKSEVIAAWRKRQDAIKTFRFDWTEQQTHVRGWIPNPRFAERERLAFPAMFADRTETVAKSLTVGGGRMHYSFSVDRAATAGGERRHYAYTSVFDGQTTKSRISALTGDLPEITASPADTQNLDTRPTLMAFRPLDPVLGHALLDRAVTNQVRIFYKGRSTMLLEERRDPTGWKMLVWLEPERDFIVTRYVVLFEQSVMIDIEIDHIQDRKWGWIPSGWRVTEKLSDGTKRVLSVAKVTSYNINEEEAR